MEIAAVAAACSFCLMFIQSVFFLGFFWLDFSFRRNMKITHVKLLSLKRLHKQHTLPVTKSTNLVSISFE